MRILILCTENSCCRQMTHVFLASSRKDAEFFSAGTQLSERVHPLAVVVEISIDLSDHTPVPVSHYLDEMWDDVITVCGEANESCLVLSARWIYIHRGPVTSILKRESR